jgi:tetratricopeptide (TPR) repeat protein
MRRLLAVICCCLSIAAASAQEDEASRANALWQQGNKLDALPLYEDLVKADPTKYLYFERLAGGLGVKAEHSDDPAEVKALLTRERDSAKRAVELGDPEFATKLMAQLNPDEPALAAPTTPAVALFNDAERAYGTGDYATALAKFGRAADADPTMYTAPLYAGDSAYLQKDVPTAVKWFARAIQVNPNRETAYRYWGDVLLRVGHDPIASKPKYIEAIVAEPYNKLAWNGVTFWANTEKGSIQAPKIDRPSGPVVDPIKPGNITINIDPAATDDKKHPGSSAWMMYSLIRAGYQGDEFKKDFPDEKQYRHTLKEESTALSAVAEGVKNQKIKHDKLDESLRNLVALNDAGMLDCWILVNGADDGIAQDYPAYRDAHRQLLHDYIDRFVIHGAATAPQ